MSRYLKMVEEANKAAARDGEQWGKLKQDLPELATALLGVSTDTEIKVWPGTLMIYVDGGQLKWSIHCKGNGQSTFGCFPERVLAIEDVERHLAEGKCEVKGKKAYKRS
jgi:hypothetical protein